MSVSLKVIRIDPVVSRKKFDRELQKVLTMKGELRKRGWIVEESNYPVVRVTFISRYIIPRSAICTVEFDFSDYDVIPPSVRFLDPFSTETATTLDDYIRLVSINKVKVSPVAGTYIKNNQLMNIIINHCASGTPFLCLPGVREYHTHPQHSNDPWNNHRANYSGRLLFYLLEQIDNFCVDPLKSLSVVAQADKFVINHSHKIK